MTAPPTAKRIEMWPLDRLRPYERNARTHSPEQVAQIVASIHEFGFTTPLLVDGDSGILAGHGRLAAAKQIGMKAVPVIVLDHLTPKQRQAYILADNQLTLNAGWDLEMLQFEIQELEDAGFDMGLTGFDDDDIAQILDGSYGSKPAGGGAPDVEPEEPADDDPSASGMPLAIVLKPAELRRWKQAKDRIGLSMDKAALMRLAGKCLEEGATNG